MRGIPVKGAAGQPRSFFDRMIAYAQSLGAPGLGYITFVDGAGKGPIAKFVPEAVQRRDSHHRRFGGRRLGLPELRQAGQPPRATPAPCGSSSASGST